MALVTLGVAITDDLSSSFNLYFLIFFFATYVILPTFSTHVLF